jgi:hypothetical protein
MTYRPRQVAVRASETAAAIVRSLKRDRPVAAFLQGYAREFNRAAKTAHPVRYRELEEMIGREALLAMLVHLQEVVPRQLGFRAKARLRPAEARAQAELATVFHDEFFHSLQHAMEWDDQEQKEFLRDLQLYQRLSAPEPHLAGRKKLAAAVEGPFVDRVGLLLDPSLFEKARRAAAKFQSQLESTADKILRTVFSRRRKN